MPNLQSEVISQGLVFPHYFDSVSLCGPSRTTILRGQYVHNHGVLTNTYIFFTSDNGFMLGQHRLRTGKSVPYEESIRVGMAVRGPGVPHGEQREQLCGNVDIAPTLAEIGGALPPAFVDGRSLVPLFATGTIEAWRQRFLVEFWSQTDDEEEAPVPEFHGVRSVQH